jgi:hypothetical protein
MVDILAFLALQMFGLLSNVGQFVPKTSGHPEHWHIIFFNSSTSGEEKVS